MADTVRRDRDKIAQLGQGVGEEIRRIEPCGSAALRQGDRYGARCTRNADRRER